MESVHQVRPADDLDVPSLALALASMRGEDLGDIAIDLPVDGVSDQHAKMLLGAVRSIGGEVLVAVSSGAVSGFVVLTPEAETGNARMGFGVAVTREWRRQGVGLALVSSAQRWSSSAGFEYMDLWVRVENTAARALYSKLGFRPSGESGGRTTQGKVLMSCALASVASRPVPRN